MNPRLDALQPYPFERLATLLRDIRANPDRDPISLAIGEPQHPPARVACEALAAELGGVAHYPPTKGSEALRAAIADWLTLRFNIDRQAIDDKRHILPAAGTREALFSFAQAVVDPHKPGAAVAMPNPGYQIYEGAALLAGAEPLYLPCQPETGFLADLDALAPHDWDRVQLLYLCSPGNPTGAVADRDYLQRALALADKHDFVIASDECYSEIYRERAPAGLLQACAELGRHDYRRCVVFHSLSKRSNLPGLRSGFVAGDAEILRRFLRYRTYHGCAMPNHHQVASIAAWNDEEHVRANRALYASKFDAVLDILGEPLKVSAPDAGFYLWPKTPVDDETFARRLKSEENVTVLPGRYLSRTVQGRNPGKNRVRMALVAELDQCVEGAKRIRALIERL